MQDIPNSWQSIIGADVPYKRAVRLKIYTGEEVGGVETYNTYYSDTLIKLSTYSRVFPNNTPSIGNCVAGEIDIEMYKPTETIPTMAKLGVEVTVYNGDTPPYAANAADYEWKQRGTYFIDTRSQTGTGNTTVLEIHGYDAMLKAEAGFVSGNNVNDPTNGGFYDTAVYADICEAIGVELHIDTFVEVFWNRLCAFDATITGYTCRELLGFIASAHGGSFVINDKNELMLVYLNTSLRNNGTNAVGNKAATLETSPQFDAYSKVILKKSESDNNPFVSGADSGRTLTVVNPFATQDMCDYILLTITHNGYVYTPYSATNAQLNPLAELGDVVEIGSNAIGGVITGGLFVREESFGTAPVADISAPADEEINHEYPIPTMAKKVKQAVETVHGMSSYVGELGERVGEAESSLSLLVTKNIETGETVAGEALAGFLADATDGYATSTMLASYAKTTDVGTAITNAITAAEASIKTYADENYASISLASTVNTSETETYVYAGRSGATTAYVLVDSGVVLTAGATLQITPSGKIIITSASEFNINSGAVFSVGQIKLGNSNAISSWDDLSPIAVFGE